jgi:hypothetical protein
MRKFTMLAVVLALAGSLFIGASSQASPTTVVTYDTIGSVGLLTITNALGETYQARNSLGQTVASGLVLSPLFTVPATNSGPDANGVMLRVRVGLLTYYVADPDWEWL